MNKKFIVWNLMVAMLAQGLSLLLSFLISFVVPKVLDIESFSFWQLFIFYITYVGFFHFGINDGVYLKYGGKNIDEMNRELVSGQFKYLFVIQLLVIAILGSAVVAIDIDMNRKIVLYYVLVYMLIFNLSNYLGYIFQAANLTKWYSYSVILDKLFFMISVVVLLFMQEKHYPTYIFLYLSGKILCLIYCLWRGRGIILCRISNNKEVVTELKNSITVGIMLTFSAMSGMLILGVGRFMIDSHWGITVFGKISFALSLAYFVLAFIQQVSMVFFPILRRINNDMQRFVYMSMCRFCFFVMPLIYILMIPGKIFIAAWLPQYIDSVNYLAILLPICVFDAKMNMIFNTYFKVLRKEKVLLKINLLTMFISCIVSVVCTFVFNSYWLVIISMVVVIIFRSILSETVINKMLNIRSYKIIIYEISFAFVYIATSLMNMSHLASFVVLISFFIFELFLYQGEFKKILGVFRLLRYKEDKCSVC